MRIGNVEVLVEPVTVAGTEPTSALGAVSDAVEEMFGRAKATIVAVGESTVDVISRLAASRAAHPEKVEVEFGLGFTAKGGVVLASAEGTASLKVKLVYEVGAGGSAASAGAVG
ncbi:CU044_2847 family protein [Amycolatopsis sp., V23-08]|uniref:CU044_2847 family protein n=1 Tax=Amycolatopsis heterodermiae TaxID=3110235 RepID=A0ABU5R247_9PSEU|nr:CU044_2847 family protein [Amycolatopsis sp., V23-08]MEA5360243.1 CU044_2847 family protein [Amycolatopsis sp., V23-08]